MPLTTAQQAALDRLKSFYEGDNPYNSVTNPGGFRQGGHLYNFVNALKDVASVTTGLAALAVEVATNSAQSPKAVRVDAAQGYTQAEQRQGKRNLGAGGLLTGYNSANTLAAVHLNTDVYVTGDNFTLKVPSIGITANDDKIRLINIGGGTVTIARSDSDTSSQFYYNGISSPSITLGPGQAIEIISDTGNWITGFRALAPEYSPNASLLQYFNSPQRWNMRRSLKLPGSSYVYVDANKTLTKDDVGTVFYTDAARTIQLPLLSECATGDAIEFFVYAGTLTLSQPAGNANPIGLPGSLGATVALTAGAYTVKKHDSIWRVYTSGVSKTGDTMTGGLAAPNFYTIKGNPSNGIYISSRDANGKDFQFYNIADILRIWEPTAGDVFQLDTNGAVYFKQIGDLNTRIEARAKAYADVAQGQAQLLSVAKVGDMMTGPLQVNGDFPQLRFQRASKAVGWGWLANTDNKAYLQTYDSNGGYTGNMLTIGTDGSLSTAQFGDVNGRIEARAKAYADVAQVAAQGTSVQKTGDTMSGKLTFSGGDTSNGLRFTNGGDNMLRGGSFGLQFCDNAATLEYFRIAIDGSITTRQFGDLNNRIEARASAFATNAQNAATAEAQYRFHAARMVFVGDLNQATNQGGMTSPYGGNAVVTDRWTYADGVAGSPIDYAKRFRQPQFLSTTQGWVAITLA